MKYCKNCGTENNDENQFCFNCRCAEFSPANETANQAQSPAFMPPPMPAPMRPYQQAVPIIQNKKQPLGIFDLLVILGFVAAIVGMFTTSIILHPLAAIASIIGFIGNTRFKALAIAGFVIAIVGGVVYTVLSLYHNNIIPQWITNGAFH